MNLIRRHARSLLLAVLVGLGGAVVAYGLPAYGHDTYYYDANGNEVGEDYRGCANDTYTYGIKTATLQDNVWSCSDPSYTCYMSGWTSDYQTCYWDIDTCDDCAQCSGPC